MLADLAILLADEPLPWIAGSQWVVLAIWLAAGGTLILAALVRRRGKPGDRRCPKCRYDLRGSASLMCSECGHTARSEEALRLDGRCGWLAIVGLGVLIAYPGYRSMVWSRDRGWTPPLSAWKTTQRLALPGGASADLQEKRSPWALGKRCRLRSAKGSTIDITGFHLVLGHDIEDEHIGIGDDITGDGVPNLIVEVSSGGAHCCDMYHIFEIRPDGDLVATAVIDARDGGTFEDLDSDGAYEFVTRDWSLAYALTCFACLAYPEVILEYSNAGYVMATRLMWRPSPTDEAFASLADSIRAADWDGDYAGALNALWSEMLRLIYTGHETAAWRLYEVACPQDSLRRDQDLASFRAVLQQSPYHPAVTELQQEVRTPNGESDPGTSLPPMSL